MSEPLLPISEGAQEGFLSVANRLAVRALTLRDRDQVLVDALQEALRVTGGLRAFLARIEQETGELVVISVAGRDWTPENRSIRLHMHNEMPGGITGYVAVTGQPYISSDVRKDEHYLPFFPDVVSEVAVPFSDAEGNIRGVLNVESDITDAFRPGHVVPLTTLANIIATVLSGEEYRNRERKLVAIGLELTAATDIDTLIQKVVDEGAELVRCDGCSVFLMDQTQEVLTLRASHGGTLTSRVGEASYHIGVGLTGTVAQTGETIRLQNPRDDPRWVGLYSEFSPDERNAFLAVPIFGRERILGVLRVSRPRSASPWFHAHFTQSDERVLRTIASQLGAAIENVNSFNRLVRSERMAAWGELSAKSAHMIGNRSFAIKGDLNELKYLLSQCQGPNGLSSEEVFNSLKALTESMERGLFRLDEILREFRDFVMATQLTVQEIDINRLVQETVTETFPKRTKVVLEHDYAPDLPAVRCDATKLKRAFSELIENAVSFQPESGMLRVTTRLIEPGEAPPEARLSPARRYVQIEFADKGPGVSPDIKDKIFTPFFTSRVKGMGLGLSIVKGIIDAHHGVIRELGTSGEGARFLIFLPLGDSTSQHQYAALRSEEN